MGSHWLRLGLKPHDWCCCKERETQIQEGKDAGRRQRQEVGECQRWLGAASRRFLMYFFHSTWSCPVHKQQSWRAFLRCVLSLTPACCHYCCPPHQSHGQHSFTVIVPFSAPLLSLLTHYNPPWAQWPAGFVNT